jgi:hypothetical protein
MVAIEKQKIAQIIRENLSFRPYILDSLEKGYGNLARISEFIRLDLKLDESKSSAIKAALRRQSIALKAKGKDMEKRVLQVLRGSRLETKYDVDTLTLRTSERLEKSSCVILSTEFADGNFYVVDKAKEVPTGYLIDNRLVEKAKVLSYHRDCTMFIVKSDKLEIEDTPGVLAYLNSILSTQDINVIEFVSCYTYTILIVSEEDEIRTVAALRRIVGKKAKVEIQESPSGRAKSARTHAKSP